MIKSIINKSHWTTSNWFRLPIEIAPLRTSTSEIINLASIAAYSADVIDYKKLIFCTLKLSTNRMLAIISLTSEICFASFKTSSFSVFVIAIP